MQANWNNRAFRSSGKVAPDGHGVPGSAVNVSLDPDEAKALLKRELDFWLKGIGLKKKPAEPAKAELERAGEIPSARFDMGRLDRIGTEVLLVAGTLDQVAPIGEMRRIRAAITGSRLAVFKSYHCLMDKESKRCRNGLAEVFFRHGMGSEQFAAYLSGDECKGLYSGLE